MACRESYLEVPLLSTPKTSGPMPRNGTRSTALATEFVVNPFTGLVGEQICSGGNGSTNFYGKGLVDALAAGSA